MQNDDYERCLALAYDECNVTKENLCSQITKMIVQLVLIVVSFYVFVYFSFGIVLMNLPSDKQIVLEKFLSDNSKIRTITINQKDQKRLDDAKNKILSADSNFPATSNMDIGIIDSYKKNALCLPNGTIYITSALYETLDDEMLLFVIAHEMGHYKNKDHLMQLRKKFTIKLVGTIVAIIISNENMVSDIISETMDFENLNYSRSVEANADLYAKDIMLKVYNNTDGGIRALNELRDKEYPAEIDIFSTHPSIDKRIKVLEKY